MKKYVKLLPVILYPYAYMIWLVLYFCFFDFFKSILGENLSWNIFEGIFIGYQILTLISVFYGAVYIAKSEISAKDAAKMNLIIKVLHIPSYIFHFILGFLASCMSVWGIGFLVVVIVIDVLAIALTGIVAIGCVVKLKKREVLTGMTSFWAAIGSFIYGIDLIVAIVLWIISKKHFLTWKIQNRDR